MMKPIILFTVIIATIIFFNVFAPVYVLTASAQGAPAYDFKVVIGEIYQNAFVFYRMGYAGAQSVVLLLFVLTLVFIQFTLFREKEGADVQGTPDRHHRLCGVHASWRCSP